MRSRVVLLVCSALPAVAAACLEPTQITVELTAAPSCADAARGGTLIAVGAPGSTLSPVTVTTSCSDGRIGSLVLVPSGEDDDRVAIEVVSSLSRSPEACSPGDLDGCIVARRQLSYLPHTPLRVPIKMSAACVGVDCPADQTCVAGTCKSALIEVPSLCEGDGCDESVLADVGLAAGGGGGTGGGGGMGGAAGAAGGSGGDGGGGGHSPLPVVVGRLDVGPTHSCALRTAGEIWCWGGNNLGQAGPDGPVTVSTPELVLLGGQAVTGDFVGTGDAHSCAVGFADRQARCWGQDDFGQLGGGTIDLAAIVDSVPFELSAGAQHTCVLFESGQVACWGNNTSGQLGRGLPGAPAGPGLVDSFTPGSPALAISAGEAHTCAIAGASRTVRCWGENGMGQVTGESTGDIATPTDVSAALTGVRSLSGGGTHSCAIVGPEGAGELICWGSNHSLSLELEPSPDIVGPTPVALPGEPRSVSVGRNHTCAVVGPEGALACWGINTSGQVGIGSTASPVIAPTIVIEEGVVAVALSVERSCALSSAGEISCWGFGPLGCEPQSCPPDPYSPTRVAGFP